MPRASETRPAISESTLYDYSFFFTFVYYKKKCIAFGGPMSILITVNIEGLIFYFEIDTSMQECHI